MQKANVTRYNLKSRSCVWPLRSANQFHAENDSAQEHSAGAEQREFVLRGEVAELRARLLAADARAAALSSQLTEGTRPLVQQLDSLQRVLAEKTALSDKRERECGLG